MANDIFFNEYRWIPRAMQANLNLPAQGMQKPHSNLPLSIKLGGMAVRALFLIVLTVLTARVASPQVEKFRSMLETPDDAVRVVLGGLLCAFFVANLFIPPRDVEAYRTWLYLGPVILPLSVLCAYVVW